MDAQIYAGSKGSVTFTVSQATEQFVAHLVVKRTNEVVGKFSYPAREGYQTLIKVDNNYNGYLTAEMTVNIANEQIKIEVKPFINSHAAPIGVAEVRRIADNTLKTIETV